VKINIAMNSKEINLNPKFVNLNLLSLIENHQGLVWMKDSDGQYVTVNSNFCLIFRN